MLRSLGQAILWSRSPFARDIIRAPGSWQCLDHIYRNQPQSWLDRKLLSLHACDGTRARLNLYRELLRRAVDEVDDEPVRLLDLGSGPGWAPLDVAQQSPKKIRIVCVDRAGDAIQAGRMLARHRGIAHVVAFHRASIRRFVEAEMSRAFDIVGTHGVLDYFRHDDGVVFLRELRRVLKPGGILLTSNMAPHRDWVARFLMEFFGGWRLQYRDPQTLAGMLRASSYANIETHVTPGGFHVLATAHRLG